MRKTDRGFSGTAIRTTGTAGRSNAPRRTIDRSQDGGCRGRISAAQKKVGAPCRTVSVSIGTVRYFTGFLSMRKPSTNKRSKARVRRPTTKTLAAPNDPVKRGARQPSPQTNGSLVGALFNSQVAVAQLMYQLSPLPMITRQQAIILDTFASAFNGALEAHDHAE